MKKIVAAALLSLVPPLSAAVPNKITYQGRLIRSGVTVSGQNTFQACFIVAGNPTCAAPQIVDLPLSGDFTLQIDVPPTIDFINDDVQLRLRVNNQDLSPTDQFNAVPYALVASTALTVPPSSLGRDRVRTQSFEAAGYGLVPPGATFMFVDQTSCPSGYSEVTSLRNRFPLGADRAGLDPDVPDAVGMTTGTKAPSHAHTHTGTSDVTSLSVNHSHTIAAGGAHNHGGATQTAGQPNQFSAAGPTPTISGNHVHGITTDGSHDHGGTTGAVTADVSHSHTFTTGGMTGSVEAHVPPALTVLFCRKD